MRVFSSARQIVVLGEFLSGSGQVRRRRSRCASTCC